VSHWASTYVGFPWTLDCDCWGFFRKVQLEQFGRQVPVIDADALSLLSRALTFAHHPERQRWLEVDCPEEGDAVLLGVGRHPAHIGVWVGVNGGSVLHSAEGHGVVIEAPARLRMRGWSNITFWRNVA
jgi:hypothetical protein